MNRFFTRLRPTLVWSAAFTISIAALSGCGGGGGDKTRQPVGPDNTGRITQQPGWTIDGSESSVQKQKKWTILVYMNAANDLEEYGPLNVNQMEQIGSDPNNLNIVVQFKRIKGRFSTIDGDWGGTRRYYVTRDGDSSHVNSVQLSHQDGLNMGRATTLQQFVQWGAATYPADHYCLVVWNHGAGWRSQKLPGASREASVSRPQHNGRGVSYDDEFKTNGYSSHIDTVDLPAAIDLGGGRKWDLLTFDSSLMQMAEVAYEVRDKAKYIVGSEESPPGEGFPYDLVLHNLSNDFNMDGRALGINFAREALNAYGLSSDTTQSVLDTSKVGAIAPAIDSLGSALLGATGTYAAAISNNRQSSESYAYPENHDIRDFVNLLSVPDRSSGLTVTNNAAVRSAVAQVNNALDDAIVFNNNGSNHPNSNGLAIFLPGPDRYRTIDQEQADGFGNRYGSLAFSRAAPNWQSFLATGPR